MYDIQKRISSTIADRNTSLLSYLCDLMIQMELEFAQRLDVSRLAKAFDLTLVAEPVLDCRFVDHWWKPYWERLEKSDRQIFLFTEDGREYEAFKSESIDASLGPQFKACLWRSSDGDRLLLKVAHQVTDAGGVKDIAAIASSIYSHLANDANYRPEPNVKGSRSIWQILKHVPWYAYPRIFLNYLQTNWSIARAPQGTHYLSLGEKIDTSPVFVYRQLPADRVARLREYGRAHEATLNDIMLAAFFHALVAEENWNRKSRLSVTMTVDLRGQYLPSGRGGAIANLSGLEYPNLGTDLGDDFASTLEKVSAVTRSRKASWIGLSNWVGGSPLSLLPYAWEVRLAHGTFQRAGTKSLFSHGVTNTGVIDPEGVTFEAAPLKACILPPPAYPPGLLVGISGYAGTITISAGVYPAQEDIVSRFFDRILSELPV